MPPIGLIAGNGRFPFLVLEAARRLGHDVTVVAVREEASPDLDGAAARLGGITVHWLSLGQLGRCIATLRDAGVCDAILAGQVQHTKLFSGVMPDLTLLSALARLRSRNTDAVISAVADVLAEHGIRLLDSTAFLAPLLATAGTLAARPPSSAELADLTFGHGMADAIAGLDIGQTIVVKDRAVVAVEAMEGTDRAIARAATLSNGRRLVVVKVSKPKQDMRFDVPVIGLKTIEVMQRSNASVLAVDAGKTLLFERPRLLETADQAGVAIFGMKG